MDPFLQCTGMNGPAFVQVGNGDAPEACPPGLADAQEPAEDPNEASIRHWTIVRSQLIYALRN